MVQLLRLRTDNNTSSESYFDALLADVRPHTEQAAEVVEMPEVADVQVPLAIATTSRPAALIFNSTEVARVAAASFLLGSISGMLYMYCYTWYVVLLHGREPCDAPLASWLTLCLCVSLFCMFRSWLQPYANLLFCGWTLRDQTPGAPEPRRVRLLNFIFSLSGYYVMISTAEAVKKAKTCSQTAPALYGWAAFLALPGALVFITLAAIMGCSCIVLALLAGPSPEAPRGADPGLLDQLDTVLVIESAKEENRQCSICLDDYVEGTHVKRTPCCGNFFHEACFKDWLQGHRTCPLCRADLQRAVEFGENRLDPMV